MIIFQGARGEAEGNGGEGEDQARAARRAVSSVPMPRAERTCQ